MATLNMRLQHYSMLGIRSDATSVEVKKGYHRVARLKHPDNHGNYVAATEKFQQLQQAYEILSDARTRYSYDQTTARELETFSQDRARHYSLLDGAQKYATRIRPSVEYKRRLVAVLELRLKQKQRAHDTEQRRILNAQPVVIISDDDPPRTSPISSDWCQPYCERAGRDGGHWRDVPRIAQDLTLAKKDLQRAATDMQGAELIMQNVKDEMDVYKVKLRKSEQECSYLEREHNPHWRDSETARASCGSHHPVFQGHPLHPEAPQNISPMPTPHGSCQAPQTLSPHPSLGFAGPLPDPEQYFQRRRSCPVHSGMPPPQWAYHPPSSQQPWPQHVQPESNPHQPQYEIMKAEIEGLKARNLENDRSMESLIRKNAALEEDIQRLKGMLDRASSGTPEKKRGRPKGDDNGLGAMGRKGAKTARRG
ncbi:hypothetical protein QBC36DRAFT_370714 [Triangularia setosa]|uniref:J domain-containing protein n=1 Tax=Triangularia setosa TaxID=2587417 RepID=A0AAN7A9A1_9PEZI|nr:hypothetical protein QBC36DRAFT_370714 [Podospora setosa]